MASLLTGITSSPAKGFQRLPPELVLSSASLHYNLSNLGTIAMATTIGTIGAAAQSWLSPFLSFGTTALREIKSIRDRCIKTPGKSLEDCRKNLEDKDPLREQKLHLLGLLEDFLKAIPSDQQPYIQFSNRDSEWVYSLNTLVISNFDLEI